MTTSSTHKLLYRAPRRDFEFLLWEQYRLHESARVNRDAVAAQLDRIIEFAEGPMAAGYRESDEQEACLDEKGCVRTPDSYPSLLAEYREIWLAWLGASAADESGSNEMVQNLLVEMLVGANPSFVTYVGFNGSALKLLAAFGSIELQVAYVAALRSLRASACLCITEKAAGSDLTFISSVATPVGDGTYRLSGHKWLISAGMHELMDNIYYFVLARTDPTQRGMMGLSCFFVPRYRLDEDGMPSVDNGIRCREVVKKMGLRGCANAHIEFSQDGVQTVAFILGTAEGRGLQQLMTMMAPARISTGIYALGLAASACDTAGRYAAERIQGKRFDQAMSGGASSLAIEQHPDIRRMHLDMLAVTTGCRALIARLACCQIQIRMHEPSSATAVIATDLLEILLPIIKAYTSDQAWKVTETAIQTMGGVGYLREYPVEQNARDCKILSIWEGTNHMQSLFLIRDKLGLCLRNGRLETLRNQLAATMHRAAGMGGFDEEIDQTAQALQALVDAAQAIGASVRRGNINKVPEFSCEFQTGLAEVAVAWQLLEGALVAASALCASDLPEADLSYYRSRIAVTRYFTTRRLPRTTATLRIVERGMVSGQ